MKRAHYLGAALLSCLVATSVVAHGEQAQASAQRQARFRAMDINSDGRITRQEWRGNARSFARRDVNQDGVLSGTEVWTVEQESSWRESAERDDALARSFRRADRNSDGILSRNEWASDAATFNRVDVNNDGVITEPEFFGEGWEPASPGHEDDVPGEAQFRRVDTNGDGAVSRQEWTGGGAAFNRRDADGNGVLSPREFLGGRGASSDDDATRRDSPAFQRGYDRGLADGRQAGREDKQLRNQWDLEGQRELEQADAGYQANVGPREDYQAGYRAGFRTGYRQGFGPR